MESIYSIQSPNEPIVLYQGAMEVFSSQYSEQGNGILKLCWLPSPQIRFEIDISTSNSNFSFGEMYLQDRQKLRLLEINSQDIDIKIEHSKRTKVSGVLKKTQNVSENSDASAQYVIFYLANFYNSRIHRILGTNEHEIVAQITLRSHDWKITIEPVSNLQDSIKQLEGSGGYSLTHIATLERLDSKTFTTCEAVEILEALFYFLSFARGSWSPPILLVGFDANGEEAWRGWEVWKVSSWEKGLRSGSSSEYAPCFYNVFPKFVEEWLNPNQKKYWKEAFRTAINWYIDGNIKDLNVESSIVLLQAGLELFCSVELEDV